MGRKDKNQIKSKAIDMIKSRLRLVKNVALKDKSGVYKIIVKMQPYQLLNTNREFFPSFDASNFHKLINESSKVRPNIVANLYFVRVCEGTIRRLAM